MADLDFALFDADNHYYESTDAFTRHMDPALGKRGVQWADIDGRRRLLVGGRICRFIPNPTFDPIARPGALDAYFRGRKASNDIRDAFGELDRIADRPEYRERDARLVVMDRQNMEACFLFPTLGVGIEEALRHDPVALHAAFHAFNEWVEEDWGFAYRDRLYAAALITLADPDRARAEIEWAIERGARIVCLRAGPVLTPAGGRSPGDPVYDPFWSAAADAGITVAYHSGDSGYGRYADDWGATGEFEAFRFDPFRSIIMSDRPILETMAALVIHGVLSRHPTLRIATIESGSGWVADLLKRLRKAYKQVPGSFPGDPIALFREHVWVAPFYEDDIRGLAERIGIGHILMGSDWPHAEGLVEPSDYVHDLEGFTPDEIRAVMHDNARHLATPRASVAV